MKKIIQLFLFLSIIYSCASQKHQTTKPTDDKGMIGTPIPVQISKFSPGTFALNIKITEIIKNDNLYQVNAIINKTLGSGAGITQVYSVGEKISFEINKDYGFLLNTDYSFLFKEVQTLGTNKPKLRFIKGLN